jgi:hypothetical protein
LTSIKETAELYEMRKLRNKPNKVVEIRVQLWASHGNGLEVDNEQGEMMND